jgi:DNA mismatch repair protein MutS
MQIGSFHEAYATLDRGFDLQKISDLLDVALTKKDKSIPEISIKNPQMLGVPTVSLHKYKRKLIDHGYTVVIIDQVTPPPNPKREVTGVYSPGTYIEDTFSHDANYILSIYIEDEPQQNGNLVTCIGMAVIDLSTGRNITHETYSHNMDANYAYDEAVRFINSYNPKEIILFKQSNDTETHKGMTKDKIILYLELENKTYHFYDKLNKNYVRLSYQRQLLDKVFPDTGMLSVFEFLDMERNPYVRIAYIMLLDYAYQHNNNIINNIFKPEIFKDNRHLILGNNAIFQLNILENKAIEGPSKQFKCLFDVINQTSTALGRRYMKDILISPIIDEKELNRRYVHIEHLIENDLYLEFEEQLKGIMDLERLHRKLSLGRLHPFEFVELMIGYQQVKNVIKLIKQHDKLSKLLPDLKIRKQLIKFTKVINETFDEDVMKQHNLNEITDSFFCKGVYPELDALQKKIDNNMNFMENVCNALSQYVTDTGKAKLQDDKQKIYIKRNDRDGYYLQLTPLRAKSLQKGISKLKSIKITEDFSLNITSIKFKELTKGNTKIFIDEIDNKNDELEQYRYDMMNDTKEKYLELLTQFYDEYGFMFQTIANFVAHVDFIKSGSKVAKMYRYCKPVIKSKNENQKNSFIQCEKLRHPIIERINTDKEYVPHDISLGKYMDSKKETKSVKQNSNLELISMESENTNFSDDDDSDIELVDFETTNNGIDGYLVYGINSCGKSSLMKAVGLSVVMAQCGLFVPATRFVYSPYESMYARITGNDNIFKGLSSFALEMTELRAILRRAGPNTLVIGDEVCRGTEHVSANSIVASTIIKLAESGSSFLFATHLHDIADMNRIKQLNNVKAVHLSVEYDKETDSLVFDRQLKDGSGLSLYGLTVARYIISDMEFMKMANEIKNEITNKPNQLLDDRMSRYNANLFVHECGVCKKTNEQNEKFVSLLDTHHINFQKNCEDGFVKDKPHMKKNSLANMVVLCKECHHKIDTGELVVNGYKDTSNGRQLDYHWNEISDINRMTELLLSKIRDDNVKMNKNKQLANEMYCRIKSANRNH